MKQLFALANAYIGSRDWKVLALVKFCLASLGLLLGLNVPARHRKTMFWGALAVFFVHLVPSHGRFREFLPEILAGPQQRPLNFHGPGVTALTGRRPPLRQSSPEVLRRFPPLSQSSHGGSTGLDRVPLRHQSGEIPSGSPARNSR